jgi:predicted PurR-regulated permease PerM
MALPERTEEVGRPPVKTDRARVPWRTIWAAILAVVIAFVLLQLIRELSRIILWLVMAGFLAAVLTPAVDFLHHRLKIRRGLAIAIVVVAAFLGLAALITAFVVPLVQQATNLADDLPGFIEDARAGRGTIGRLIERYDLQNWVNENQEQIQNALSSIGTRSLGVLRSFLSGIFALLTIFVLTVFIVGAGPRITRGIVMVIPEEHRQRAQRIGGRSARAVSGYVFGQFVICIIAGLSTWIVLSILGVPYAGVLGLWVAFAAIIPMVGATLGAIPTIGFAFLHSTTAGIVALIFYIAYQQFENHVLQPLIMSKSVKVSPLAVLVAVLCGVELAGFAGALLAVPAAGIIQVIIGDIYDWRRGELRLPVSGETDADAARERRRVRELFVSRFRGSARPGAEPGQATTDPPGAD